MAQLTTKIAVTFGMLLALGAGTATVASAQTVGSAYDTTLPAVSSNSGTPAIATDPSTATATSSSPVLATTSSTSLAFTGADIGGTVALGGVLVGGGIVMVRLGRRKHKD